MHTYVADHRTAFYSSLALRNIPMQGAYPQSILTKSPAMVIDPNLGQINPFSLICAINPHDAYSASRLSQQDLGLALLISFAFSIWGGSVIQSAAQFQRKLIFQR